jgi:hypothetical protein
VGDDKKEVLDEQEAMENGEKATYDEVTIGGLMMTMRRL